MSSDTSGEEGGRGHRLWLRLNLALLLLLIVAFVVQISALRGCTHRAQRACAEAGGLRVVRTEGFGPLMRCTYECQQQERLATVADQAFPKGLDTSYAQN